MRHEAHHLRTPLIDAHVLPSEGIRFCHLVELNADYRPSCALQIDLLNGAN